MPVGRPQRQFFRSSQRGERGSSRYFSLHRSPDALADVLEGVPEFRLVNLAAPLDPKLSPSQRRPIPRNVKTNEAEAVSIHLRPHQPCLAAGGPSSFREESGAPSAKIS